ncbi:MAG: glycosyltransferase family 2 protein [Chloroflexota bacterium]
MTPTVSIIIPCYNERRTIGQVLEAIRRQTHPLRDLEVLVADGMSNDGTRQVIADYARAHPDLSVRIVDNPARSIPAALNRAIEHSHGQVIIRIDAHALPYPDYVERCLETLNRTDAANVGGVWEIHAGGQGWRARAIAAAAGHPLGAGDARYRTRGQAGPADTVPFGAFRRQWLERVGGFDETLLTNEDYELNARLRRAGGIIWLDPRIRSIYYARSGLGALARQYFRYGFWKSRMLVRNVDTLRWRQALPPLFVAAGLGLALLGAAWHPAWALLGVQLGAYASVSFLVGAVEAYRRREVGLAVGFPLAIWTMHSSWGSGFLWGLLTWAVGGRHDRRHP